MAFGEIKEIISGLPGVSAWPELADFIDRAGNDSRPDWDLPILACQAVGGDESTALYGAAAIAFPKRCMPRSTALLVCNNCVFLCWS